MLSYSYSIFDIAAIAHLNDLSCLETFIAKQRNDFTYQEYFNRKLRERREWIVIRATDRTLFHVRIRFIWESGTASAEHEFSENGYEWR